MPLALRFALAFYASLPLAQPGLWAVLHMDLHGSGGRTEPVRAVRERSALVSGAHAIFLRSIYTTLQCMCMYAPRL